MMVNWKHRIGATALAVALLASTGGFLNEAKAVETGQLLIKDKPRPAARGKSATIKPNPPSVAKGKSATIPVELPTVAPPSAEKGIKDQGVKSCGSCGLTGRVAAPPAATDPAPPPPSTEFGVDGQILDRGKHLPRVNDKAGRPKEQDDSTRDTSVTERRAQSGPGGTPPAAARSQLCGVPYTPPCVTDATQRTVGTAKKGGISALALGIGGLAAIAAVVAVSGGGTPVSR